jgi:hypothetical protein
MIGVPSSSTNGHVHTFTHVDGEDRDTDEEARTIGMSSSSALMSLTSCTTCT